MAKRISTKAKGKPTKGKKAATPKRKTATVYQRAIKKFTAINKQLPEGISIPYNKRKQIVSQLILPKFKGRAKSSIRQAEITAAIESAQRRIFPRNLDECNLAVAVGAQALWLEDSFPYFAVDSYIKEQIPQCIYVKVSAGIYGETDIFYVLDYSYDTPLPLFSVKDIVEGIREAYTSDYETVDFFPIVKVKPGSQNDGRASSYYLDLVLEIADDSGEAAVSYTPTTKDEKNKFKRKVSALKVKYKRATIKAGKLAKAAARKKSREKKVKIKNKKK